MKFPGCILMILTFAVLAFFFMYLPDIRTFRTPKAIENNRTAKDALLCGLITLFYAAAAFANLGSLSDPETFTAFESGGSVMLELENASEVDAVLMYTGINTGNYSVAFSENGKEFYTAAELDQDYVAILKWQEPELICAPAMRARYVRISAVSGAPRLGEIALFCGGENWLFLTLKMLWLAHCVMSRTRCPKTFLISTAVISMKSTMSALHLSIWRA